MIPLHLVLVHLAVAEVLVLHLLLLLLLEPDDHLVDRRDHLRELSLPRERRQLRAALPSAFSSATKRLSPFWSSVAPAGGEQESHR